jgi:hypothetical protein
MKINDKILRLVKHGLKATNLTKLNESQINSLYNRLVEQTVKQTMSYEVTGVDPKKKYSVTPDPKKPNTVKLNPVTEKTEIDEKSVSKKQHGLMGAAYSVEKGDKELKDIPKSYRGKVKKVVDSMSKKQVKDFAKTKTKNLPDEVNEEEKYDLGDAFQKHAANYMTKVAQKSVPRIGSIGESELEKEITRLVEKHLSPKMTKKDFINIIENNVVVPRESKEMTEESEVDVELPSWLRWETISKK